jgi:hypothetical protein
MRHPLLIANRGLGAAPLGANAAGACPTGFAISTTSAYGSIPVCVNAAGQDPAAYYDQLANWTSFIPTLALLLVLPGWFKVAAIIPAITGIPGITFPDGSPMFRPAFYGGL